MPAFAAAGLAFVNFVWVLAALPESLTPERRAELAVNPRPPVTAAALLAALRRPVVGPLLTTRLFYALAFGIFQASFALWAARAAAPGGAADRLRARLRRRAVRAGPGSGHRAPHAPVSPRRP